LARGDDRVQALAEQLGLAGGGAVASKTTRNQQVTGRFPAFSDIYSAWESPNFNAFGVFQGRLFICGILGPDAFSPP